MVILDIDTLRGATKADIIEDLQEVIYYLQNDYTSGITSSCSTKWNVKEDF